jgi:hypothetical protein
MWRWIVGADYKCRMSCCKSVGITLAGPPPDHFKSKQINKYMWEIYKPLDYISETLNKMINDEIKIHKQKMFKIKIPSLEQILSFPDRWGPVNFGEFVNTLQKIIPKNSFKYTSNIPPFIIEKIIRLSFDIKEIRKLILDQPLFWRFFYDDFIKDDDNTIRLYLYSNVNLNIIIYLDEHLKKEIFSIGSRESSTKFSNYIKELRREDHKAEEIIRGFFFDGKTF